MNFDQVTCLARLEQYRRALQPGQGSKRNWDLWAPESVLGKTAELVTRPCFAHVQCWILVGFAREEDPKNAEPTADIIQFVCIAKLLAKSLCSHARQHAAQSSGGLSPQAPTLQCRLV